MGGADERSLRRHIARQPRSPAPQSRAAFAGGRGCRRSAQAIAPAACHGSALLPALRGAQRWAARAMNSGANGASTARWMPGATVQRLPTCRPRVAGPGTFAVITTSFRGCRASGATLGSGPAVVPAATSVPASWRAHPVPTAWRLPFDVDIWRMGIAIGARPATSGRARDAMSLTTHSFARPSARGCACPTRRDTTTGEVGAGRLPLMPEARQTPSAGPSQEPNAPATLAGTTPFATVLSASRFPLGPAGRGGDTHRRHRGSRRRAADETKVSCRDKLACTGRRLTDVRGPRHPLRAARVDGDPHRGRCRAAFRSDRPSAKEVAAGNPRPRRASRHPPGCSCVSACCRCPSRCAISVPLTPR